MVAILSCPQCVNEHNQYKDSVQPVGSDYEDIVVWQWAHKLISMQSHAVDPYIGTQYRSHFIYVTPSLHQV